MDGSNPRRVFSQYSQEPPDLNADRLARTRDLMNHAVRDVLVENYEDLIDGLDLPDPNDRHVLAAAVRCGAQVIVTWNVKDFPAEKLSPYNLEAQDPDEFLLNVIDLRPSTVSKPLNDRPQALETRPPRLPMCLLF